jgi:hypothetical protein
MKKRGVGGFLAVPLAVALMMPAAAQNTDSARYAKRHRTAPTDTTATRDPQLPVENALRWGYSQGTSNYPSGFGGLYGDGRYPGNVISSGKSRP